jgi:DnaJ-class molecular chaperone
MQTRLIVSLRGALRKHRHPCGQCNGSGKITQMLDNKQVEVTCPICNGTGQAT